MPRAYRTKVTDLTEPLTLVCKHDWRFDGDDPYIVCAVCHERRDAISGRVITAGIRT